MAKLNDTQTILLSTATQRADGSLYPLPQTLQASDAVILKAVTALLKRSFVLEVEAPSSERSWRLDGDQRIGVVITDAGRTVINAEPAAQALATYPVADQPVADAPRPTKAAAVLALLQREEGATLAELVEATGWLPHTTRAALTGIRKKGHGIIKGKRGAITCYSLAA